jgi:hypothetical protein
MAKSGIQTRRQARTWLPEFNLHLAGSIKARLADAQTTQIHLADAIVEQAVA